MKALKDIQRIDAIDLADFILNHYGPMSHLKLQKLLFYCEAYHLAQFQEPLIKEEFQAWMHGPVCVEVYHELKGVSQLHSDVVYVGEKDTRKDVEGKVSSSQFECIEEVLCDLSSWSGKELRSATHHEEPWIKAREGFSPVDVCHVVIPKEHMRAFYTKAIYG